MTHPSGIGFKQHWGCDLGTRTDVSVFLAHVVLGVWLPQVYYMALLLYSLLLYCPELNCTELYDRAVNSGIQST